MEWVSAALNGNVMADRLALRRPRSLAPNRGSYSRTGAAQDAEALISQFTDACSAFDIICIRSGGFSFCRSRQYCRRFSTES